MKNEILEFLQCRPVDDVTIRREVQRLLDENQRMKSALLTGSENKRRYSGHVHETLFSDAVCACGETVNFSRQRKVPWSVIEQVLQRAQKLSKI